MSKEMCVTCEQPTGKAGIHDDSNVVEDVGPCCDDCWESALTEAVYEKACKIAAQDEEIKRLEEQVQKLQAWKSTAMMSYADASRNGHREWAIKWVKIADKAHDNHKLIKPVRVTLN